MSDKLCINCKHYVVETYGSTTVMTFPESGRCRLKKSLVTGNPNDEYSSRCWYQRKGFGVFRCGKWGKNFEPKETGE